MVFIVLKRYLVLDKISEIHFKLFQTTALLRTIAKKFFLRIYYSVFFNRQECLFP